jgi:quinol monooxygenase YgiN
VEKVVRISIGRFDEEKTDLIRARLMESYDKLAPGIRTMKGNISFFAGIDSEHSAIVNVSEWESMESAKQMETFQPMLDLARVRAS